MKIAIVHDWLVTNAGAEKVLKALVELYPDADIFSLVDFLSPIQRAEIINSKEVTTSFIQKLPFAKKHFRNYLPLFPKAIESLNLKSYDLIISSSWAVAKGIKKKENQLHISYCYTPIRYAWDLYDEYTSSLKQPKKFLVQLTLKYLKAWDKKVTSRVDEFISISSFIEERVQRIYGRESTMIYPCVNTHKFSLEKEKEDFYLTASRLVPYKKTKLIVEAFNEMPDKKLVVIGMGEDFENIKAIAKGNILLLGYQDDTTLTQYMQKAKAFVYAAVEDFGIVPIEAMACGTPVIALKDGGTLETIVDGENGVHFKEQTKESIIEATARFETLNFDTKSISKNAASFSTQRFKKEFTKFVETATLKYNLIYEDTQT